MSHLNANQLHYNRPDVVQHYDQTSCAIKLAQKSAHAMLKAYSFNECETEVMDYACGTGLISKELAPYAKSILGVDISLRMVDQYNHQVYNQGIPSEEMHAICAILEGRENELDGRRFDVIVCASAYHHIESFEHVTTILTHFLKPNGALLVVDLEKTDVDIHDCHRDMVPHQGGIEKVDIENAFRSAHLESFTYSRAFSARLNGQPVAMFIAKGTKRS